MQTLSIITITFNDHEGLRSTAESLDSSFFEWLVIDGSSDLSIAADNRELLKDYQVRLIQEPDAGRFDAMNKGLKLAQGEIVCFLNGGDRFSDSDVPLKVASSFKEYDWDWAVGDTRAVNAKNEFLWKWPMPNHNSLKFRIGVNSYCHQATFVKKQLLLSLNGFDSDSLYSDWVVSLVLSQRKAPHLLNFETTLFLADGISSQQTIEYWRTESSRLRARHKVEIGGIRLFDKAAQRFAAAFIATTRGQLIRPDLVRKYG